jgi:hypothetical protein
MRVIFTAPWLAVRISNEANECHDNKSRYRHASMRWPENTVGAMIVEQTTAKAPPVREANGTAKDSRSPLEGIYGLAPERGSNCNHAFGVRRTAKARRSS